MSVRDLQMGKKDEGRLENAKRNEEGVLIGGGGGACVLRDGTEEGLNGH